MTIHREIAESFPLTRRPRTVRIVHRATDRVCLEVDVFDLNPDELNKWVGGIQDLWDWWIYKLEVSDV